MGTGRWGSPLPSCADSGPAGCSEDGAAKDEEAGREGGTHAVCPLQVPEADPHCHGLGHAPPGPRGVRSSRCLSLILCREAELPQEFVV